MKSVIVFSFLLLFLLNLSCTSNPVESVIEQSYKIVFDMEDRSSLLKKHIYIMDENGSIQKKLSNRDWSGKPVLSPDRTKIAFVSSSNSNVHIFSMNLDGTEEKQLTHISKPKKIGYSWSPDGTKLVFESNDGIYLVNSDGTDERKLTNSFNDRNPAWSPDGNKIIFNSYNEETKISNIFSIGLNENNLEKLTHDSIIYASSPRLIPGDKIAFLGRTDTDLFFFNIYLMNADGSDLRKITPSELNVSFMAISPDENRIAFCHYVHLYKLDLYVINIDGTGLQKLNPEGFNQDGLGYIHWSPDGNKLAVSPGYTITDDLKTNEYGIYTINPNGSKLKFLGEGNNPQLISK